MAKKKKAVELYQIKKLLLKRYGKAQGNLGYMCVASYRIAILEIVNIYLYLPRINCIKRKGPFSCFRLVNKNSKFTFIFKLL